MANQKIIKKLVLIQNDVLKVVLTSDSCQPTIDAVHNGVVEQFKEIKEWNEGKELEILCDFALEQLLVEDSKKSYSSLEWIINRVLVHYVSIEEPVELRPTPVDLKKHTEEEKSVFVEKSLDLLNSNEPKKKRGRPPKEKKKKMMPTAYYILRWCEVRHAVPNKKITLAEIRNKPIEGKSYAEDELKEGLTELITENIVHQFGAKSFQLKANSLTR